MRITRWQRLKSHIEPVMLEETTSEMNPYLAVALSKGRLQLLAGVAIYSWDDLYDNFRTAFERLDIKAVAPRTCLVLGGGLCSIPYMLEHRFKLTDCAYTVVEFDPVVSELATKYALPRHKSPIKIITEDAVVHMELDKVTKYDLICIDVFWDDVVPDYVASVRFVNVCREALAPGGLLLFNRLYQEKRDRVLSDRFYQEVFLTVFPEGEKVLTPGNLIAVGRS